MLRMNSPNGVLPVASILNLTPESSAFKHNKSGWKCGSKCLPHSSHQTMHSPSSGHQWKWMIPHKMAATNLSPLQIDKTWRLVHGMWLPASQYAHIFHSTAEATCFPSPLRPLFLKKAISDDCTGLSWLWMVWLPVIRRRNQWQILGGSAFCTIQFSLKSIHRARVLLDSRHQDAAVAKSVPFSKTYRYQNYSIIFSHVSWQQGTYLQLL